MREVVVNGQVVIEGIVLIAWQAYVALLGSCHHHTPFGNVLVPEGVYA